MLEYDLAELYGAETRRLKKQVKRNLVNKCEDLDNWGEIDDVNGSID